MSLKSIFFILLFFVILPISARNQFIKSINHIQEEDKLSDVNYDLATINEYIKALNYFPDTITLDTLVKHCLKCNDLRFINKVNNNVLINGWLSGKTSSILYKEFIQKDSIALNSAKLFILGGRQVKNYYQLIIFYKYSSGGIFGSNDNSLFLLIFDAKCRLISTTKVGDFSNNADGFTASSLKTKTYFLKDGLIKVKLIRQDIIADQLAEDGGNPIDLTSQTDIFQILSNGSVKEIQINAK